MGSLVATKAFDDAASRRRWLGLRVHRKRDRDRQCTYSGSPVNRSPHSTAQPKIIRIQNLPITPPKIIIFQSLKVKNNCHIYIQIEHILKMALNLILLICLSNFLN
jgi:hypothetical protein